MGQASIIAGGTGEIIGDAPERRVEILSDHDAAHVTWSRYGPRRDGADLHVHRRHTDFFYVLDGELTLRLGTEDDAVVVPRGTLACIPPLVVHGFRNGSDAEVRYLNIHAPGQGFAAFLRASRDGRPQPYDQEPPPADGTRPPGEAVIAAGELLADRPGVRVSLLADRQEIGISDARLEPGGGPPPPHVHHRHVESFYVLGGALAVTTGRQEVRADAGAWVQIPPGVPHSFSVVGPDPVHFLNLHAPGCGFGTFLRALHAATDDDELAAARAAFDQEPA
jgi:mannose-6-phosphate isomerase-like protein (cupin superfamily)